MRIFLVLLIILFPVNVFAAGTCTSTLCTGTSPWTAENCNRDTVNYCLSTSCAPSGGTIILPACNVTWLSSVSMDASARNLTLIGNGATDDAYGTIITSDVNASLYITGGNGYYFDVSKIVFKVAGTNTSQNSTIHIAGTSRPFTEGGVLKGWRIHNNAFDYSLPTSWPESGNPPGPNRAIMVSGYTYGLVDANTVTGKWVREFVTVDSDDFANWKRPQSFGDINAVFVENNTITWTAKQEGRPVIEGEKGGRYVFRYNTVRNSQPGGHGFDSGNCAGIMSQEVYNNDFSYLYATSWSENSWDVLGQARAGTGVWHNNSWSFASNIAAVGGNIRLIIYRAIGGTNGWKTICDGIDNTMVCSNVDIDWNYLGGSIKQVCHAGVESDCPSYGSPPYCKWTVCLRNGEPSMQLCDPANGDTDCGGNGTCTSYLDGSGTNGYPCFQQPGRSTDNALAPFYQWNNTATWTGHANPSTNFYAGGLSGQLTATVDYFNSAKTGYSPYTCPHPLAGLTGRCDTTYKGAYTGHLLSSINIGTGGTITIGGTGGTISW